MSIRIFAKDITADGDNMCVLVTAETWDGVFDLRVTVHTSNADFALAQAQERLAFVFDSLAKELRVAGLQLECKSPNS